MSAHHDHSGHSHHSPDGASQASDPGYRRVLWMALVINFAMFGIEIGGSWSAHSTSLLADSMDFLGDGVNYTIALLVLGSTVQWRAKTALFKALCMAVFGLGILVVGTLQFQSGELPVARTMGSIAVLAASANLAVAWMLYAYRNGDANMRSVWLCTRNDVIGNLAVLGASLLVASTQQSWPDFVVAIGMALLALHSAWLVAGQALQELRHSNDPSS
jgi:Co/Zn/Cd efflux system component